MNTTNVYRDPRFLILKLAFLIFLVIYFSGCSKNEPSAETIGLSCTTLQGHYVANLDPSQTLDIADDCTFTDSYCAYDASYTVPTTLENGFTDITVLSSNASPACMNNGTHNCQIAYRDSDGAFAIDCGGSQSFLFWRQ